MVRFKLSSRRLKSAAGAFIALAVACDLVFAGTPPAGLEVYRMDIREVTRLGIKNNFDIQLARYDARIAATDEGVAESIYDTLFTGEVRYRNDQSARTSTILGTKDVDNDYNIGLSKTTPSGTTVSVEMTNNRSRTNSQFATSKLVHDSSLGISVEQELGRNFFGVQDRGGIKTTLIDIENARYTSLDKIEVMLSQIQKAYWDLVLSNERVDIEKGMLAQAERLLDLQKEKLKVGLVESPDVFAAQANYQNRLNTYRLAENDARTKNNTLKLLLNIEGNDIVIEPADTFALGQADVTLEASLRDAMSNRRDFQQALNDARSRDIKLTMRKQALWPEINLSASWTQNGLGDHFRQAVTNITDENNPELFAGLTITWPLENTKAEAEFSAAQMQKARVLIRIKLLEREIAVSIMDQVRSCRVYREIAENSDKVTEFQEKKLGAEEKRFLRGRSNTDTMIRFQEDLLAARLQAAQAKQRYHSAMVDLRVKEATLLKDYWHEEEKWTEVEKKKIHADF